MPVLASVARQFYVLRNYVNLNFTEKDTVRVNIAFKRSALVDAAASATATSSASATASASVAATSAGCCGQFRMLQLSWRRLLLPHGKQMLKSFRKLIQLIRWVQALKQPATPATLAAPPFDSKPQPHSNYATSLASSPRPTNTASVIYTKM